MPQSPEALVRRLIEEGFNQGNLDVADELISPDLLEHQNFGPDHAPGAEGVKAVIASLRRAFSDFHLAIDDLAVDGDTVWLRMTGTGTNDGSFMGHPADRPRHAHRRLRRPPPRKRPDRRALGRPRPPRHPLPARTRATTRPQRFVCPDAGIRALGTGPLEHLFFEPAGDLVREAPTRVTSIAATTSSTPDVH